MMRKNLIYSKIHSTRCISVISYTGRQCVHAVASQTWKLNDCANKHIVEQSAVAVLFTLSEGHDVESMEDHLYICPSTTTTTTTINTAAVAAAGLSAVSTEVSTQCTQIKCTPISCRK